MNGPHKPSFTLTVAFKLCICLWNCTKAKSTCQCSMKDICAASCRCLRKSHLKVVQKYFFQIDLAPQSWCRTNLNSVIAGNRVKPVKSHDKALQCDRGLREEMLWLNKSISILHWTRKQCYKSFKAQCASCLSNMARFWRNYVGSLKLKAGFTLLCTRPLLWPVPCCGMKTQPYPTHCCLQDIGQRVSAPFLTYSNRPRF